MEAFAILMIEDSEDDRVLFQRAFKRIGSDHPLRFVNNFKEAVDYLTQSPPFEDPAQFPSPGLILVDIKMPGGGGLVFLQWLREQPGYNVIPTIVLSGSRDTEDIRAAYRYGANSYILKPDFGELEPLIKNLLEYWTFCEKPFPAGKLC